MGNNARYRPARAAAATMQLKAIWRRIKRSTRGAAGQSTQHPSDMRCLLDCHLLLVLLSGATLVLSQNQYDDDFGPAPPRLSIPGAVALGPAPRARPLARVQARRHPLDEAPRVRSRPPSRGSRLQQAPPPPPAPQFFAPPPPAVQQRPVIQQQTEEVIPPRPVVEDAEDDYQEDISSPGSFVPNPTFSLSQGPFTPQGPSFGAPPAPSTPAPPPPTPPQPQRPAPSFRPERPAFRPERPALLPTPSPELNYVSPSRQQLRPTPLPEEPRKSFSRDPFVSRNKVRPTAAALEEPQQFSRQPPQTQQFSRQPPQPTQQQYNRQQSVVRAPLKQSYVASSKLQDYDKEDRLQPQKPKKPVAQVLNRYRNENEDGSITWGYENDDGSFKEETIGTDCVTYGKYGYVDPDGTRREYTYSTGIPCDKTADNQEQPSEGYIDYAENKYVLPNGDSIDLNKMVKNRARRPVQQQQYRN